MGKYSSKKLKGVKGVKRLVKQYPLVRNAMGYGPSARGDWIESRVIEVDSRHTDGGVFYYMQCRIPKRYKYWYTRDIRLVQEAAIHSADQLHFNFRYGGGFKLRNKDFV